MTRFELFVAWYKQLTSRGYSRIMSIEYAWYNSKRFNLDGTYKK